MVSKWVMFVSVLLALVLALAQVSALSLQLNAKYVPAESVIAQVEGEMLAPITPQQIEVRRGHVLVPVEHDVQQLGSATYVWLSAPRSAGNYTLVLKDVQTREASVAKVMRVERNFSVEGEIAAYAVRPAAITAQKDFELSVELYRDSPQVVQVSHPKQHEVMLVPGMNVLVFPVSSFTANEVGFLTIGMYRIPVYAQGNVSTNVSSDGMRAQTAFWEFSPARIAEDIRAEERLPGYVIRATYHGNATLKNVKAVYNASVLRVQPESFRTIMQNQSIELNVSIVKRLGERYRDVIVIGQGNETLSVPVELVFLPNVSSVKNRTTNVSALPYCTELSGIVCAQNNKCSKEVIESRDGACCTGVCEQEKKSNAWIGFLLLGVLVLVVAFAWMRYKKVKTADPLQRVKSGGAMQESVSRSAVGKEEKRIP